MNKKESFWDNYWDLSLKVAVLGIVLSPIVVGGIYIYKEYIKPDPIEEFYCYCLTTNNKIQLAKLHFRSSSVQQDATRLIDGKYDNVVSNRVTLGDKVLVYEYHGNPSVAKVEWARKNFRGGYNTDSGWVPKICLHSSPPPSE